jgi:hypothetical protein
MNMPSMTHEQRAIWIRRVLMLLLAMGVVAGAWYYRAGESAPPPPPPPLAGNHYNLEILHFHQAENAASREIALSLNKIAAKYAAQVLVTRLDLAKHPLLAQSHGVKSAPHVVMVLEGKPVYAFHGVRPYPEIERKVDELLRGLKRVGKDWLPEVKGMQPMSKSAPPAPTQPAPR